MQTSSDNGQEKPDEWANNMEDSPMMTVEYLRARLLSERLVSKAAKARAEELAKRVEELEEQLKIVTFQRKRAEKATLEVLSFLASQGISEISDVYESESDLEESLCESNEGRCDLTEESENFGSLKLTGNNEASGSDHDSTTSSGRALSWKGRKETAQLSDKKMFDSSIRRRMSFTPVGSAQRHRLGKSCRQNKRREMRSVVEESRHDSAKSNAQVNRTMDSSEDVANCLDRKGEELERFVDERAERVVQMNGVSLSLTPEERKRNTSSPSHTHVSCGDMERALEHKAQLIGRYEAQEKAQRDWEEKYAENNISTPDSYEPGNHSDVTEDRDDNKESVPLLCEVGNHSGVTENRDENNGSFPQPGEVACCGDESKAETNSQGKESPIALHADTGCSQGPIFTETHNLRSQAPDFSFSRVNNDRNEDHVVPPSFHLSAEHAPYFTQIAAPIASSSASSSFCESEQPENLNRHRALVPKEEPQRLGMVLGALEEAKLLIKQRMNGFPETSSRCVSKATETSSGMKNADWLKVPVGCLSLFRVPANLQSQATTQNRFLGSDYSSELSNSSLCSRGPLSQGSRFMSSPMDSWISTPFYGPCSYSPAFENERSSSMKQSKQEFTFDTGQSSSSNLASSSYPSFPDFAPGTSSKQMCYSPAMTTEAAIPSSRTGSAVLWS